MSLWNFFSPDFPPSLKGFPIKEKDPAFRTLLFRKTVEFLSHHQLNGPDVPGAEASFSAKSLSIGPESQELISTNNAGTTKRNAKNLIKNSTCLDFLNKF